MGRRKVSEFQLDARHSEDRDRRILYTISAGALIGIRIVQVGQTVKGREL